MPRVQAALGSTINIFTSVGVALYNMLITIAFIATLLPEPVAPATRRWGIFDKSATTGVPNISLPRPG